MKKYQDQYLKATSLEKKKKILNKAMLNLSAIEAEKFIAWQTAQADQPGQDLKARSNAIVRWLSDHPLISRNALCAMVSYDTSNLQKAFNGSRIISAKYLDAFEMELSKYGYQHNQ